MSRRLEHQASLYEILPPIREGNPLFCHQDFLEKMDEQRANTVGRRAALLLQRLWVDVRRMHYKPTQGENRGWRRSPLGGNHGSHFYAWWAPRGAAPVKQSTEFEGAPEGAIFLRDIRHHDDHRPLNPQSLEQHYLPIGIRDLRQAEIVPAPWTPQQARFADSRQKVRIVKGFPGSGKTTALWHAADVAGRQAVLYVTYSPELAALARDHFDKFAPGNKRFHVATFAQLVRQLAESDAPLAPLRQTRAAFVKEVSGFSPTTLGPWVGEKVALYDEAHAHLFGGVLPIRVGDRFVAVPDRKVPLRQYRESRERDIGRAAAEAVFEVCETIRRRSGQPIEQRYFSELDLAWRAVERIRTKGAGVFSDFDCIALDEAQDLTPIEALVMVELAAALGADARLLVAGDEAQTVRPTDFEWGWFQDLIHHRLGSPIEFKLQTNLRSPRRIANLVNRVWDLYDALAKQERPSGGGLAEIDENSGDQIVHCAARPSEELNELLEAFANREGLAMIALSEEAAEAAPEHLRDRVLSPFEAKGLDFQSVCVLGAGKHVDRILQSRDRGRGVELDHLSKRLAIDQLRVALSRPAERLYWLDISPGDRTLEHAGSLLTVGARAYPVVPAVLLKSLGEEALSAEERVRLCEHDARQFLDVKPSLAWSRARQAVALLGDPGSQFSVNDLETRTSAHLTLCQVAFTLAFRRVALPPEVGRIDLFYEARMAALAAGRDALASVIDVVGMHERNYGESKLGTLTGIGSTLSDNEKDIEPWLLQELQPRSAVWLQTLEEESTVLTGLALDYLPAMYRLFTPLEAEERTARLRQRVLDSYMRVGLHRPAMEILKTQPDPDPLLMARCREGMGELEAAAQEYLRAGHTADALRCYRAIPDFDKTLELLATLDRHPAKDSLEWMRQMRDLAAARPPEFGKTVLTAEKKLLEEILETSLGVSRKKAAAKTARSAPRKPASPRKTAAPKKSQVPPSSRR